jgi:hypothetical protein
MEVAMSDLSKRFPRKEQPKPDNKEDKANGWLNSKELQPPK